MRKNVLEIKILPLVNFFITKNSFIYIFAKIFCGVIVNKLLVVSAFLALVSCSSDPASPLNIASSSSVDELSSSSVVDVEVSSSSVVIASSSSVVDELSSSSVVVASSSSVVASSSSVVASSSSVVKLSSSSVVVASSSSVVEELSSSSELAPIYGRMVDARNNQSYITATIGTQTWMADNLNIGTMVPGKSKPYQGNQSNDAVIEKYCYDDIEANCAIAGGLYQWAEAMGLHSKCNTTACDHMNVPNYQGICPDGWHLPSTDDWDVLAEYLGGYLIASSHMIMSGSDMPDWDNFANRFDNKSGYSALPWGYRSIAGIFDEWGNKHGTWGRIENASDVTQALSVNITATIGRKGLVLSEDTPKLNGFSIRCVKNK